MKKHNLFKVVGISILVTVLLTWILPTTYYQYEITSGARSQVGLFDLFSYPSVVLSYFGNIALYILIIGGFYGILSKIGAYRSILDSIVKPIYRIGFLNPPSTAEFNVSPPPYQCYVNELSILYIPVPYYYCYYEITVRISDGHNIASTTFEACTEFPYSSIYHTGGWHGVIPYIYHAGSWVKAVAYINDGSNWCEPDSSAW